MFAVVMAGGSGTRFWPASREKVPKQFLPITSDATLLEETLDRVRLIATEESTLVVINRMHEDITRQLTIGRSIQILTEPVGRNTAPCIGLAALHIARCGEDDPMVVLPADHFIPDHQAFARTVNAAAKLARSGGIVTIGVAPTRPETGYGYIEVGKEAGRSVEQPYFSVVRFLEKPDTEIATNYVMGGRHLWNSGIFVFTPRTILAEIKRQLPRLSEALEEIAPAIGTDRYTSVIERVYPALDSVSIDYGVMEKTDCPVYVFRADFQWSDVGSWQALRELRTEETDGNGNLILGEAVVVDAQRNLIYSGGGRVVTLVGVEGLVVVDTPDALMVADLKRSQEVRKCTEILRQMGRDEIC